MFFLKTWYSFGWIKSEFPVWIGRRIKLENLAHLANFQQLVPGFLKLLIGVPCHMLALFCGTRCP